MPLIHAFANYATNSGTFSGLSGIQADQRDYSPFLIHFTSYAKMEVLRNALKLNANALEIKTLLDQADLESAEIVSSIACSQTIRNSKPQNKDGTTHNISECVCFSECNISGIISHAERYGRFGFVFNKNELFCLGCRPCIYVDEEIYTLISKNNSSDPIDSPGGRLYSLSNIYVPSGCGKVQDYTHEREWRLFSPIDLTKIKPIMIIAPNEYIPNISELFPGIKIFLPIDFLFLMGA